MVTVSMQELTNQLNNLKDIMDENPHIRKDVGAKLMKIKESLAEVDKSSEANRRARKVVKPHINNDAIIQLKSTEQSEPIMKSLNDGFQQFKERVVIPNQNYFVPLAAHQSPQVMVIGCCDSRVDPDTIFGTAPGEIFTVRSIANLVPKYEPGYRDYQGTSAALEYAVTALKVKHIIVLGHQFCGGIKALMSRSKGDPPKYEFIDDWMSIGQCAAEYVKNYHTHLPFDDQCRCCEREAVNFSLNHLMTYPWIKDAVHGRELNLYGGMYNMMNPTVDIWPLEAALAFAPLAMGMTSSNAETI